MSKPSLPFPLVAFEFLTDALVLVITVKVQGQECLPSVSETENGTASRGAFDRMLKQKDYGRSGMLHTHVASSRCSSIWSQIQNGVLAARSDDTKSLKGVGLNWISSRDISLSRLLR
jgi:hypothetical protein